MGGSAEGKDTAPSPPWPLPPMFPHYHPPSPRVTTWGLALIGDNAADKMRLCGPQVGHQLVEVLLEVERGEGTQGREAELETAVDHLRSAGGQAPPRVSTHLSLFPVNLCPLLLDWVLSPVFTPHPTLLRPPLYPPNPAQAAWGREAAQTCCDVHVERS